MNNVRVRLIIAGVVQGVWFRESTRRHAQSLGIAGWVRNCSDGTVEIVAEGPLDQVKKLIQWCNHGPPAAKVDRVQVIEESWRGEFDVFYISR
ncbi:MAG: acylphosphatase [Desulfobacteraceae bacterium]|jgi:acylphosphatase|nr:MAG: acylphosphatase [Desulfobacteraceae bacterium]